MLAIKLLNYFRFYKNFIIKKNLLLLDGIISIFMTKPKSYSINFSLYRPIVNIKLQN